MVEAFRLTIDIVDLLGRVLNLTFFLGPGGKLYISHDTLNGDARFSLMMAFFWNIV